MSLRKHFISWKPLLAGLLLAVLAVGTVLYSQAEKIVLGAEAYLFGYPLVMMDVTRANAALTIGPENQLRRVRQFPDTQFKEVVRPNVDTLYTTAFIDIAKGPWVFEMAANTSRYEVMPFMDAWTNVFAAPGTRTTGQGGGKFLLVGANWQGVVPPGLQVLRSPTQMVWLIGRTQTNGVADYPVVHRLQDQLSLQTLSDWTQATAHPIPPATADSPTTSPLQTPWQAATEKPIPPIVQMQVMPTQEHFQRMANLMVNNPPSHADAPMMLKLERIGVKPGEALQWTALDRWSVSLGRWIAERKVAQELSKPRDLVRGWATPPAVLGQFATHYNIRAVVAMVGLGANLPADAMYPNTREDAQGQPLNGRHRYRLHFQAGQWPPVNAFWSLSAYGKDDFFIENPLKRYALGSRDPLQINPDGSLDIWIQAQAPGAGKQANWLPVQSGEPFLLNARLYWPKAQALDGTWGMPALERLDE